MKLYKIKKSNIDRNGRGLYATKDIKEGARIIDYVGKIITKKQTEVCQKNLITLNLFILFNLNNRYDLGWGCFLEYCSFNQSFLFK